MTHLERGRQAIQDAAGKTRFRLWTATEIENLPRAPSLVGEKIPQGALAALVGPSGGGKTFVSLAMACGVAGGVPTLGDTVHEGPVIYVAAEGSAGLGVRVRAWKSANHFFGPLDIHFVTEPVSLVNPVDVFDFLGVLGTLPTPPVLVVIDTLARCMIGGDENSAMDMGNLIAGADRIRTATGATVLILHHMSVAGERERGSTALRGACDTLMFLKAEGDSLTLTCEKQKDAAPFPKTKLRLVPMGESCAVFTADRAPQLHTDALTEKQLEILLLLRSHFLADGPTTSEWLKVSGSPERTFYDARTALVNKGYVKAPAEQRGGRYTLTERGERVVTANCGETADILRRSNPNLTAAAGGSYRTPAVRSNGSEMEGAA